MASFLKKSFSIFLGRLKILLLAKRFQVLETWKVRAASRPQNWQWLAKVPEALRPVQYCRYLKEKQIFVA